MWQRRLGRAQKLGPGAAKWGLTMLSLPMAFEPEGKVVANPTVTERLEGRGK